MPTYIALLRGINVGGHHKVPMKELRATLIAAGFENVQTYIASGNVVFQTEQTDTAELASQISAIINDNFGFEPNIMILTKEELATAIQNNPYPQATEDHKSLHLYFLLTTPEDCDLDALENLKKDTEQFELINKVFYLHAPDGIGRSKLAEKVERHLGVSATARNWRTVTKIMEMINALKS